MAIEIAPGYSAPGSYMRDLFELSKLLDLYSLLNVPLYVWMAMPSADRPDPSADPRLASSRLSGPSPSMKTCKRPGPRNGSPWPSPSRLSAP